jgi:hypothetical protein
MSESTNLEDELDRLLVDDLVESAAESEAEQDVIEDVTLANTIESGQETISIVDDELDDISEELNIDDSTVQTAKSLLSQYHNNFLTMFISSLQITINKHLNLRA